MNNWLLLSSKNTPASKDFLISGLEPNIFTGKEKLLFKSSLVNNFDFSVSTLLVLALIKVIFSPIRAKSTGILRLAEPLCDSNIGINFILIFSSSILSAVVDK